jgi:hypothetical protein
MTPGEGIVHPRTDHEVPEDEYRYSSTLSLISALDGGGWSTTGPGRFTPQDRDPYPFYGRLCRPKGRFGRVRKISATLGFDLRTVQPLASRYTVYAIPVHVEMALELRDLRLQAWCS